MGSVAGLDVSKDTVECCARELPKILRVSNSAAGIAKLITALQKCSTTLVVLEATGGYESRVYRMLWAAGIPAARLNPRQLRSFALSLGRRAKNDLLDAEVAMHYGEKINPEPKQPPIEEVQKLKELLTRRQQLTKMLVAEKNHAKAPDTSAMVLKNIRAVTNVFVTQIHAIDSAMNEIINSSELKSKAQLLQQQTGVGPILICTLFAEMPELGSLTRNQAAALVGVAPFDKDSGNHKGKRAIAGGRVKLRCTLYMATLSAIRHNPILKAFYQRLLANGKPRKVAIVACMRKFIIFLNTLVKEQPHSNFIAQNT